MFGIRDHDLICTIISVEGSSEPQPHVEMSFRDTRNLNKDLFLQEIKIAFENIEPGWGVWYKTFSDICNKHAPIVKRRISRKHSQWIDEDILLLLYD